MYDKFAYMGGDVYLQKIHLMKRFLLILAMCISVAANAQFYSSERVYVYKYDHTEYDGIRSKNSNTTYYWINFQNDMMGKTSSSSLSSIQQRLMDNPSYYEDEARNDLARRYSEYRTNPPFEGSAFAQVWLYKYCSEYSTGSKVTYREASAHAISHNNWTASWGTLHWNSQCYSFSSDKSEMIIWSTSNPGKRDYYKKIDQSELKPNVDFLY